MTVEWTDDPRALVARDWTSLVAADPDGTIFHTPRYLKLYWEEFGAGTLQTAHVSVGGEQIAAAAFELTDDTLTFLGGFDVTDYLGPVGVPESRGAAAKELMSSLASRADWRAADLAGLPKSGAWLPALAKAADDAGLEAEPGDDAVAPLLRLPDTYDSYLESLSGKLRHEIRRKDRRLREALPDVRLVESSPDTVADDLGRFVELHRTSTGRKGTFMVPGMELFFRRLADDLLPDGMFRLMFLETGGDKVAGAVAFRWDDTFFLYNSAFDHAWAGLSPGMVLVAELIRCAIEEGCRSFDMLKGDLRYKYRFGARPRRVGRLRLRRR
jgi:CelD/BcsL family acetyltransferase involved in cellulose biosynthesis